VSADSPVPVVTPRSTRRRVLLGLLLVLLPALLLPPAAGAIRDAVAPPTAATAALPQQDVAPTAGDLAFRLERLAGSDRYGTAAAVSRRFFPVGVPVAFVVSGANFPDGLAAGPAGARLNGPVLFTAPGNLSTATRTELTRLRPGRIVVVGGTSAVSQTVANQLAALTTGAVTRVAGADRYATAAAVSRHAFPTGAATVYVATGASFPDALSGGAAAAVQNAPLLLTATTSLPAATRTELVRLNPSRIMVLGGTAAVSASVATELARIAQVERVAGDDRYQTSLALSRRVFGVDRPGVMLASGLSWPDALASGAPTRFTRGPLILTRGTGFATGTTPELTRLSPTRAYVLGGRTAQSTAVPRLVQKTLGVCWAGTRAPAGSQQVWQTVPGAGKQVAFTLDMGGRLGDAGAIVDWLAANQVCTTFFITGASADTAAGRAVIAKIAARPHLFEVGNHTYHHCDFVNGGGGSPSSAPCQVPMTRTFIRNEMLSTESRLQALLPGMALRPYWRPPYGVHNAFVREAVASVGYTKTIHWNRDTIDWSTSTTTSQIVARATSPLPPNGTIVLAHLGGYHTLAALPQVVSILRANGYTLTTISDMRD
jgi:putative cell wall-binding protein/peptidoglycan/xylan/chitin deacetylase (PgdA/CDA1 family)